jgi:hypothetical protein
MADISGIGKLSKRTDLGVLQQSKQPVRSYTGGKYGENKAMAAQQAGAPLQGTAKITAPKPKAKSPLADIVELGAPSSRRSEPITTGINRGDGGGTELMRGMPNETRSLADTIKYLIQFDSSGDAELIYNQMMNGD